jgi:hypothetical protein
MVGAEYKLFFYRFVFSLTFTDKNQPGILTNYGNLTITLPCIFNYYEEVTHYHSCLYSHIYRSTY